MWSSVFGFVHKSPVWWKVKRVVESLIRHVPTWPRQISYPTQCFLGRVRLNPNQNLRCAYEVCHTSEIILATGTNTLRAWPGCTCRVCHFVWQEPGLGGGRVERGDAVTEIVKSISGLWKVCLGFHCSLIHLIEHLMCTSVTPSLSAWRWACKLILYFLNTRLEHCIIVFFYK